MTNEQENLPEIKEDTLKVKKSEIKGIEGIVGCLVVVGILFLIFFFIGDCTGMAIDDATKLVKVAKEKTSEYKAWEVKYEEIQTKIGVNMVLIGENLENGLFEKTMNKTYYLVSQYSILNNGRSKELILDLVRFYVVASKLRSSSSAGIDNSQLKLEVEKLRAAWGKYSNIEMVYLLINEDRFNNLREGEMSKLIDESDNKK